MADQITIASRGVYLADHAVVEGSGKLYVHGAYVRNLNVPGFPVAVHLGVVAVVEVPWSEYHQDHTLQVRMVDADGHPLPMAIDGQFRVGADPSLRRGDPTMMPFAAMVSLPFERPGDFALVLSVNDVELDQWPFRVQLAPGATQGPSTPLPPPPPGS